MQEKFYISKNEEQLGPFSIPEIVKMMQAGEVFPTDYLFDESKEDWVLLMECESLSEALKNGKPMGKPAPREKGLAEDDEDLSPFGEKTVVAQSKHTPKAAVSEEWFVLKWDNRYGPFSQPDIVKMLQKKTIFEFDYIWKAGMDGWQRLAEVSDFAPESIKGLLNNKDVNSSEIFFRRRHKRSEYNGSIIVHNNDTLWKGESFEISEGGAGVVMHNAGLLPGETIYLHFKPGDSVPPFNAHCEIISKQYVKGVKNKDEPIKYGVKFLNIHDEAKGSIVSHVKKSA